MRTAIINMDTHLHVPKWAVNPELLEGDLRVVNQNVVSKQNLGYRLEDSDVAWVDLWEDDGKNLIVPRGYTPPYLPGVQPVVRDMNPVPEEVRALVLRIPLRSAQKAPAEALLQTKGDGLLCLGCGKGKTILALWRAYRLRRKTLIIVDRDYLVEQWKQAILKCFWIPPEYVGHIQGKKFTVGQHFTVAVVHTLAQHNLGPEFYDSFGFVIVDECHMLAAPTFSQVLPRIRAQRLGLSATPSRRDGMDPVFRYHLGGMRPIYTDVRRTQSSQWYFKRLPRIVSEQDESTCYRRLPGKFKRVRVRNRIVKEPVYALMRPRYESYAYASGEWAHILLTDIAGAVRVHRNVLVLGGRKAHLEAIQEALLEMGIDAGLVTSEVKGRARWLAFQSQVILATHQLASRALDIDRLDTLLLLFPTNDADFLRQAVGRIDRERIGKLRPKVLVYVHDYVESLGRKSEEMRSIIYELDPNATIKTV